MINIFYYFIPIVILNIFLYIYLTNNNKENFRSGSSQSSKGSSRSSGGSSRSSGKSHRQSGGSNRSSGNNKVYTYKTKNKTKNYYYGDRYNNDSRYDYNDNNSYGGSYRNWYYYLYGGPQYEYPSYSKYDYCLMYSNSICDNIYCKYNELMKCMIN